MSNLTAITTALPHLPTITATAQTDPAAIVVALSMSGYSTQLHKRIITDDDLFSAARKVVEAIGTMVARPCVNIAVVWNTAITATDTMNGVSNALKGATQGVGVNFEGSFFAHSFTDGNTVYDASGAAIGTCGQACDYTTNGPWELHDLLLAPRELTGAQKQCTQETVANTHVSPAQRAYSPTKTAPKFISNLHADYHRLLDDLKAHPCVDDAIDYLTSTPTNLQLAAQVCKYSKLRDVALAALFEPENREEQATFWTACASLFDGNLRANAYAVLAVQALTVGDTDMASRALRLGFAAEATNSLTVLLIKVMSMSGAEQAVEYIREASKEITAILEC